MFRGITLVNLDSKGRIAVPARYRARLEEEADGQMIITIDTEERCLLLYPNPQWEIIEQKLQNLASFNHQCRRVQRLLIGHATDIEIDNHGRILLPSLLRDYAGLDKRVMIIGQGNKFELWGESQWEMGRDAWLAEDLDEQGELPAELQNLAL